MKIVISAGHGLLVRGASGIIDEVDEARKVVPSVADWLRRTGHSVIEFYDDTSTTQSENLDTIINFHNAQDRDADVSIHFNCFEQTDQPVGTEVLYLTQESLASRISAAIAKAGNLIDRGAKYRNNLAFLNGCDMPAVLLEICFVDSEADVEAYLENFEAICKAIGTIGMQTDTAEGVSFSGKCSWFGGPEDMGVDPDESLAFIYEYKGHEYLFLDEQPPGTTGLARRLDPNQFYVACRWDYGITPKTMLDDPDKMCLVKSPRTGRKCLAWPADWGPHDDTDRVADLSPGLMDALGIKTDDEVLVLYPIQLPTVLLRG
jgi:N-acetylmuramoyl-L-alanine amidase